MFNKTILAIATLAISSVAVGADVKYDGPKYDLSGVQPEFRVGFMGDESMTDIISRNECMIPYLEQVYNVPVKFFTFKDVAGTMESFLGGNLDYAWFGSSSYAGIYLEDPEAGEPVVTRMHTSGAVGYYSVMVARKDSGIENLEDMKGKKLGFADPNSTSGFLVPSIELAEKFGDLNEYFASTDFMGGHENGVLAVLNKDVDAAVTWTTGTGNWYEGYSSGNLRRMVDKGILNMDDIVLIWTSKIIPSGPIVLRKALPQEAKDAMVGFKQWLVRNDPECNENVANGVVKDWVPVDHSMYEGIVKARKAKIEAAKKGS